MEFQPWRCVSSWPRQRAFARSAEFLRSTRGPISLPLGSFIERDFYMALAVVIGWKRGAEQAIAGSGAFNTAYGRAIANIDQHRSQARRIHQLG